MYFKCKISDYIYDSDKRCRLQMSMYVNSLMMAEMISRNMAECKNKFIVQLLVVKNLHM